MKSTTIILLFLLGALPAWTQDSNETKRPSFSHEVFLGGSGMNLFYREAHTEKSPLVFLNAIAGYEFNLGNNGITGAISYMNVRDAEIQAYGYFRAVGLRLEYQRYIGNWIVQPFVGASVFGEYNRDSQIGQYAPWESNQKVKGIGAAPTIGARLGIMNRLSLKIKVRWNYVKYDDLRKVDHGSTSYNEDDVTYIHHEQYSIFYYLPTTEITLGFRF